MNSLFYDFHSIDSKITPAVRDEEYCYGPGEKENSLWTPFLSFPITQMCNFRCVYCGAGGEATASEKRLISVDYIDEGVRQAAAKGVK